MICTITFSAIVTIGIIVLSRKYGWKGFKVKPKDIISWAIYGLLIPIWIQFEYVFTNINFPATLISTIILAIAFVILFAICKKKRLSMLPIVIAATVIVYLILSWVYVPANPSDWSRWTTFGKFTPMDVFGNAIYLAPPWIVGLAIARVKPKLAIVLPAFVFPYNICTPAIIDKISHLFTDLDVAESLNMAIYLYLAVAYTFVAVIVAILVRRVRG